MKICDLCGEKELNDDFKYFAEGKLDWDLCPPCHTKVHNMIYNLLKQLHEHAHKNAEGTKTDV